MSMNNIKINLNLHKDSINTKNNWEKQKKEKLTVQLNYRSIHICGINS